MSDYRPIWDAKHELYFLDGEPLSTIWFSEEGPNVTCNVIFKEDFPGLAEYCESLIQLTKEIAAIYGWSHAKIRYALSSSPSGQWQRTAMG